MKRAACILILAAVAAAPSSSLTDLDHRNKLVEFNNVFNVYFRTFMGCPKGAVDPSECNEKLGSRDYPSLVKVMRLSQELWPQEKGK